MNDKQWVERFRGSSKAEQSYNNLIMMGVMVTFLFIGWILLNAPNIIVHEERYVPVENTTVIADPVFVDMDSLSFKEAFELTRIAKGPYSVFYWQGNIFNTCHPEELELHPDKCNRNIDYSELLQQ